MKNRLVVLCLFPMIFIACKKDDKSVEPFIQAEAALNKTIYDTIYPKSYFPAFPGSYWVYNNGDSLKISGYEKYVYNNAHYTAMPDYDTVVLPKLSENKVYDGSYVYEYAISKSKNSSYKDPAFSRIVSEKEGEEFGLTFPDQGHQMLLQIVKVDTTVQVGTILFDHVVMTRVYDQACVTYGGMSPEKCAYKREYYAKDVGLIKREYKVAVDSFRTDIELVNYHIQQ